MLQRHAYCQLYDLPTCYKFGDPGRIRTCGIQFRKLAFYSAELRGRNCPEDFSSGLCSRNPVHGTLLTVQRRAGWNPHHYVVGLTTSFYLLLKLRVPVKPRCPLFPFGTKVPNVELEVVLRVIELRNDGLLQERHVSLLRRTARLVLVAAHAAQNQVRPRTHAALRARDHVVEGVLV